MKLYNTATRKIEEITPQRDREISFYTCGPTVYDYTHIGHLRTYVNSDLLRRTLESLGLTVKQVMNITDVGHLTGDTDSGEDKLEKGAKKMGKDVWEVAKFYTDHFISSIKALNIDPPTDMPRATGHIDDMTTLIRKLEEKGFTYQTNEAIYFDTQKFPSYGELSGQKLEEKQIGAREEVYIDKDKKHPADFALWFFLVGRFKEHQMHWPSPWAPPSGQSSAQRGAGFPGWHLECSAMSMKYLGETLDIHAGGVDHIAVHHENELAQSEAATGKPFVRHWFHSEFLLVEGEKMSKSKQNFYTIEQVVEKGFNPLALRYLFLQTHYRKQLNFTWEALSAAQQGLNRLYEAIRYLRQAKARPPISEEKLTDTVGFTTMFTEALENDLQMPQALSIVWQTLKSNIPSSDKLELLLDFDRVLGLGLSEVREEEVPGTIEKLKQQYEQARASADYTLSDRLRSQAQEQGFQFEDTATGTVIKKVSN